MSVLAEIISGVREDLAARRTSLSQIHDAMAAAAPVRDVLPHLRRKQLSVIAEVKRSSPSKGALAEIADPAQLARSYELGGASAVSVLTEARRFSGSLHDLDQVRAAINLPILRKDFMVDEYQFFEARAHGADIVLLIVAALSQEQLHDFFHLSRELGMRALVEVHTQDELERAVAIEPDMIGINSRNLKTLEVDPAVFATLLPEIPEAIIRVAESGITNSDDAHKAHAAGADTILVGEALVKDGNPELALRKMIEHG